MADGWTISWHARGAIARRGFRLAEVIATCTVPQQTYTAFDYGPDRWVYQRGHVSVALNPKTQTIITVLLRSESQWDDDDARRANAHTGLYLQPEARGPRGGAGGPLLAVPLATSHLLVEKGVAGRRQAPTAAKD